FHAVLLGEPELRIAKNPREFPPSCRGDQRHSATLPPVRTEPSQTAGRKQQRGENNIGIEYHSPGGLRGHLVSRAQSTASLTSLSVMPSFSRCAQTSSTRLR